MFESKNILVTGGAGYIGKYLCSMLSYAGHKVTSVDLRPIDAVYEHITTDVSLFIQSNLLFDNLSVLKQLNNSFDFIIHLACVSTNREMIKNPEISFANNISTTLSLLEYCRNNRETKFIYFSSSEVLKNPKSLYGISKQTNEDLILNFVENYGVNASVVRPFNVFGPYSVNNQTLINTIKTCVQYDQVFNKYGNDENDYVHVSDLIVGIEYIMDEMETGEYKYIYELGTGTTKVSVSEILEVVLEYYPLKIAETPSKNTNRTILADKKLFPKKWRARINVLDHLRQWFSENNK